MARKKIRTLPKVIKRGSRETNNFLVPHYSPSGMALFSTNPILFKIQEVNGDYFATPDNASAVLGKAFHTAMEIYYGGNDELPVWNEQDAIEKGMKAGVEYIEMFDEDHIQFNTRFKNKQSLYDTFAFAFNAYVSEMEHDREVAEVETEKKIKESVDVNWRGHTLTLPVPLKGVIDKLEWTTNGIVITDYKVKDKFEDEEKIDGRKILAAISYYLLVYALYGEAPYAMRYEVVKYSKNKDGGPQVQTYEIVFSEHELYFDFFFRFYEDMTRALNGDAVFVPNIDAFFDNEVAMIAYIHRLDVDEEQAKLMKKHKVDNITELLKKEIQNAGNMRKLMKTAEQQFVSAKSLNYTDMQNHEKIKTKLMEYGMVLDYHSTIQGSTVDQYRYIPSIGLKMSRVRSFVDDIEQVLGVSGVRVLAPVPNTEYVGFEVPKKDRIFPPLPAGNTGLELAIGEQIHGEPRMFDIREAPHMLVAGASGAGKSVFLSSVIEQLKHTTSDLHLFDPKIVELAAYSSIANEYESEPEAILKSLRRLIKTMDNRYKKMAAAGARSLGQYGGSMKRKIVVIDEFGDLTAGSGYASEITDAILRIAQKGRAAGIHLVIATQSPRTTVITGSIKANFPTKVVFRTAKAIDSQVVTDESGAEKLLGKGDMLFVSENGTERLQGYNV